MPVPGDPANSVYVSIGLNANAGSRPGPVDGSGDTYVANYESVEAWHNARNRDLVTANETEIAECYNDWPSGLSENSYQMTGWIADDSHEVVLRSALNQGPTKVPEDGFHIVGVVRALYLASRYMRIRGLGLVTSATAEVVAINQQRCRVEGCFIRNDGGAGCIFPSTHYIHVFNCFLLGGTYGISSGSVLYAQNNTIRNCDTGIQSTRNDTLPIIKNNVVFGSATADYNVAANSTVAGNVSQDGTAPGSVYTITNPANEFVGSDGSDLHILETAGFRGLAEDRSGSDPNFNFSTDIDRDDRTVPWDCGADEFVGGVTPPGATQNAIFHGFNF